MSEKVGIENLPKALINAIGEYSEEIQAEISEAVETVGKECKVDVRDRAKDLFKSKNGNYYKGWTTKKIKKDGLIKIKVHNRNEPHLTHLLEYGHKVKNQKGGPVLGSAGAYPHVGPAENLAVVNLERRIKEVIK